ncbi:piggyBac transposable element-derived protein 4-like [Vespula maculifrons]|uniref:PiggyBac transposable element-derived protein 4-like n=1 Tax=Vespula maculifrons TaxID=7453 RepID=A0ABD2CW52_VESMC
MLTAHIRQKILISYIYEIRRAKKASIYRLMNLLWYLKYGIDLFRNLLGIIKIVINQVYTLLLISSYFHLRVGVDQHNICQTNQITSDVNSKYVINGFPYLEYSVLLGEFVVLKLVEHSGK